MTRKETENLERFLLNQDQYTEFTKNQREKYEGNIPKEIAAQYDLLFEMRQLYFKAIPKELAIRCAFDWETSDEGKEHWEKIDELYQKTLQK